MSQDWFQDVQAFHKQFLLPGQDTPTIPNEAIRELRERLNKEEFSELLEAENKKNLPGIADSIVDLIYVLIGMAICYGIDIRPVWDAVQKANMYKAGGAKRADGKVLKPQGWQPPDVARILREQGWRGD